MLLLSFAALALFALPGAHATAAPGSCSIGTPWLPPYGTAVGVGTSTPSPGTEEVVVCAYGVATDAEVSDTVTTGVHRTSGAVAVLGGTTAMLCWPPASSTAYWCDWASVGALTATDGDTATVAPNVSVCEARHNWSDNHCVGAAGGVGIDGPTEKTTGVGGYVLVCDNQVGFDCPLPVGFWIDLASVRDAAVRAVVLSCGGELCG